MIEHRKYCTAFLPLWLFISISSCLLLFPLLHAHLSPSHSIVSHHRHHKHAPKAFASEMHFMHKLFHQFENGRGIGNGAIGYVPNVAVKKCAAPAKNSKAKGKILGPGLQFELKTLAPTERYIRAELHLRGRPASGNTTSLEVVDFVCTGEAAWPVQQFGLMLPRIHDERVRSAPGWAAYDAMTPLMYRSMDELGELYINFMRDGKLLDEQQLRQFVRAHQPFLILYTDTKAPMPTTFHAPSDKTIMRKKREARATLTNYVRDDERVQQHMDSVRKTAEYYSYGMAKGINAGGGKPMDNDGEKTFRMLSRRRKQKSRKATTRRASSSPKTPRYPGFDPNDPMLGFGTPYSPWQRAPYGKGRLLQSPNYGNSLNDIRALREHAYRTAPAAAEDKSKEANAEDGDDETKVVLMAKEDGAESPKTKCALHNMTVDFRHLGWSDRIIAPKSFEAGFCAGQCQHTLEQDSNPSNHAILQSLMVAQQQKEQQDQVVQQHQQQIPTVCCAPDSFDSLTLLYFDERDNVVLKSYPRMVALSCGCL